MGKTHEALVRAEKEFSAGSHREHSKVRYIPPVKPNLPEISTTHTHKYEELNANILLRFGNNTHKTIMFTSTAHNAGCSTTAAFYAALLSRNETKKVLLVDVNYRTPSVHDVFSIKSSPGILDLGPNCADIETVRINVGAGGIYAVPIGGEISANFDVFESVLFNRFISKMREKYDYVIFDAPPITLFAEARIIASKVDGVVLVVEANRTRKHTALTAKKYLKDTGAFIIGVVLNKRKYYIPNFIYKLL